MICSCVLQKPDCKQELHSQLPLKTIKRAVSLTSHTGIFAFICKVATVICLLLMGSNDIESTSFWRVGINNNCEQIISLERNLHSKQHALALGWKIRHCCPSLLSMAALYQTSLCTRKRFVSLCEVWRVISEQRGVSSSFWKWRSVSRVPIQTAEEARRGRIALIFLFN